MIRATRGCITMLLVGVAIGGSSQSVCAQPRSLPAGERMPAFTRTDIDGATIDSESLRGRSWFLTFLTAHQRRSERALADLADLVASRREAGHLVDLLMVTGGGDQPDSVRAMSATLPPGTKLLQDPDDVLWGRLGVVVTPTTFLVDGHGTIRWVRAGHSFDFTTRARTRLDQALGLTEPAGSAGSAGTAGTADNTVEPGEPPSALNAPERAWRHLRMTRVLARRGEIDAAVDEIQKARDLTPDVFEIETELAELHCRREQSEAALALLARVTASGRPERARMAMLTGWAHRQRGDLELARPLLEEAVNLDPRSSRALSELGRIFEARGECRRAMDLYRRALDVQLEGTYLVR